MPPAGPQLAASPGRPTPRGTPADSPSSSTRKRATGTSWATTLPSSSSGKGQIAHKVVIPQPLTRNAIYRDPLLFPNFIHTQKRNPTTHLKVNAWHLHLLQKGVHHRQVLAALLFCTLDLYLVWDVLLIRLILKLCHAGSFSCC